MTEFSGLWTTTSGSPSGDQQVSYSQAQLSEAFKILSSVDEYEGISASYLNSYEPTDGGTNTVDIDTGVALVDGKYHISDAIENVNIPSASGGGNTRIDRIVLRADWSAFTIRIHRIAGTDAADPSVPSITQNSGTLYDIKVCQVLVDTSGNITILEDEREYANISTDSSFFQFIGGVLSPGNETLHFLGRQGGDASNFETDGTTDYDPNQAGVQFGSITWTGTAAASGSINITFPTPFDDIPLMWVSTDNEAINARGGPFFSSPGDPSQATIWWKTTDESSVSSVGLYWLAIGPIP